MIAGVEITTDEAGRFNLNALHQASGLGANKAPAQWLRTKQAQELVAEVEKQTVQICIVSVEGRNGGTFAHELLAISYAGWISPAFQLQVNQVFLDYRTGRIPAQAATPALTTMEILQLAMQSEQERLRLAAANQELEHKIEVDAPLVRFAKQVEVAPDAISVAQAAKILGTGQKRLFAYLRQIGWVTRLNEPYQAKIEQGLLDVKISPWEHPTHGLQRSVTALLTGRGLAKLQQLWATDQGRLLS